MNKRIRELAEQARIQYEQGGAKAEAPGIYYHENVVSRFAELIIDECEQVVDWEAAYSIKEHFEEKNNGNITAVVKSSSVL